mgnify:FL=1
MYKNKHWGQLSYDEQLYIITTCKKGPVAFDDLGKSFMPAVLYVDDIWAINCFYTFHEDELQIAVDPDSKFFKAVCTLKCV